MSGRRVLAIFVGVLGLVILVLVVVFLTNQAGDQPPPTPVAQTAEAPGGTPGTPAPAATPSPTGPAAVQLVEVVVSFQTVPRGWQMTEAELSTDMRLASEVPSNALTQLEDAIGLYARNDIYQGETLTTDSLVRDPTLIGVENFGPSSLVPQGWVAMAVPSNRLSGVAYGLAAGDTIDIMLTFTLNAIDEEFQTLLNNSVTFFLSATGVEPGVEGQTTRPTIYVIDPYGRFEQIPTGDLAHIAPSENTQRPFPVAVLLQNARVVNVGLWQPTPAAQPPTPTPPPDQPTPTPGAVPEPTLAPPSVLLVALPPQQQLFLKYALETHADIDYALRSVNDGQLYTVQNVNIEYLLQQFGIPIPPNFTYTIGGLDETSLEAAEVEVEVAPAP
ncbi:MAG: SAF domain-containing protein [Candidatus Promineifilaceae bacterium]